MADAKKVVEVVSAEIRLLKRSQGKERQIAPLRELLAKAEAAGDGTIPDSDITSSALHSSQWHKLVD